MLTISEVKEHLRIDHDADDALLAALIQAADNHMVGAIDGYREKLAYAEQNAAPWENAAKLAQMLMIADWYENRLPVEQKPVTSVTLIVQDLQHTAPEGYNET